LNQKEKFFLEHPPSKKTRQSRQIPQVGLWEPAAIRHARLKFGNLGNLFFISLLAVGPINFEGKL
jgi:hypothetical protein